MGKRRLCRTLSKGNSASNQGKRKLRKCNSGKTSRTEDGTSFQVEDHLHQNNESETSPLVKQTNKKKDPVSTSVVSNHDSHQTITLYVPYNGKEICVVINYSSSKLSNKYWIILTHGAGGDLSTPQLKAVSNFLVAEDFVVARFTCKGLNIKYRTNVFSEILKTLYANYSPKGIFVGGRSMGARAAVMLISDTIINIPLYDKLLGVICLSYPLHKVNDINELRDGPLLKLQKPVFFLSGTKDEMCKKSILEKVLQNMKSSYKVQWLENYDHSAKSNQDYQEDIYQHAFREISRWCQQIYK